MIKMAMETHPGVYKILVLRQTINDMKIHWESTEGYQPLTLDELKEQRPARPLPFRVKIQRDSYYNDQFADSEVYQSVIMIYPGKDDFRLWGYIRRDNNELQDLLRRLEFESPSMVLNIKYPAVSQSDDQVEVVSIASESWFD